ncbi:hypothetical protein [Methylorubrum zatmanii]|uniref:Uncharacterized protein n=1 Tax=Methylorubrum zatmanii TaxID=29429 RepID=A0ABW1WTB6_9HYPH|nr:hypothetical protein [Methylorubrum zatmanii]MBD8906129.1 hypothetical protein [Methylorubrum zatmanii]
MRPTALLAAALCLSAGPCLAQGVPPNPFASNYPSAPPRMMERDDRPRASHARRPVPPARIERGLLPPAEIPGR